MTKANTSSPAPNNALTTTRAAAPLAKGQVFEGFKDLLAEIPTVDEDPTESMILAVLTAHDVADWETVFTAASFKESANRQARVHTFRVSPSQFGGPVPYFLVLDVTWLDSGERAVITCGSQVAMAQLVNAWKLNALPIDVEIYRKPTPTRAGFYPMRLKYLGRPEGPLGDPGQVVSEQ